jgi:uncharacterized protein (TIGR03066 family)
MFKLQNWIVMCLLLPTVLLAADKEPIDSAKVVGKWRSVKLEGKAIGTQLVSIEAEFSEEGRVKLTAQLKVGDEVQTLSKEGTYKVAKDEIETTFEKEDPRRAKAWFEQGNLVMQEVQIDSRVQFERVKPMK